MIEMNINVEHPKHYNTFTVECIEMMRKIYGDEAVKTFCELNAFKYKIRAGEKGSAEEDLKKANWYLEYKNKLNLK